MSAVDLQNQIDELEREVESRQAEMGPARDVWLDAAGEFLADFWLKEAEKAVKENPEVSRERLGPAGVKALRAEVEGMAERSEEIARTHLFSNRPDNWPDQWSLSELLASRGLNSTHDYFSRGEGVEGANPATFIEASFARTAGLIGEVLKNHGLPLGRGFEQDWEPEAGTRVTKARFLGWSKEMGEAINVYAGQLTELVGASKKLRQLKREKEEGEAADLWNASG